MEIKDIIEYINDSPNNANQNVLNSMLTTLIEDQSGGSDQMYLHLVRAEGYPMNNSDSEAGSGSDSGSGSGGVSFAFTFYIYIYNTDPTEILTLEEIREGLKKIAPGGGLFGYGEGEYIYDDEDDQAHYRKLLSIWVSDINNYKFFGKFVNYMGDFTTEITDIGEYDIDELMSNTRQIHDDVYTL